MFAAPFYNEFSIRPTVILYGGLLKNTCQLFGLQQFVCFLFTGYSVVSKVFWSKSLAQSHSVISWRQDHLFQIVLKQKNNLYRTRPKPGNTLRASLSQWSPNWSKPERATSSRAGPSQQPHWEQSWANHLCGTSPEPPQEQNWGSNLHESKSKQAPFVVETGPSHLWDCRVTSGNANSLWNFWVTSGVNGLWSQLHHREHPSELWIHWYLEEWSPPTTPIRGTDQ